MNHLWGVLAALVSLIHLSGLLSAAHAVWNCRTTQGAIAWSLSLFLFPYLALPAYWILGRNRFEGYVRAMRYSRATGKARSAYLQQLTDFSTIPPPHLAQVQIGYENLARFPLTHSNQVDLLIDGAATFAAIFEAIEKAEHYILSEFYIVADDQIGREYKRHLLAKARQGVKVYFLYDEMGSLGLGAYLKELRQAGVEVHAFRPDRGVYGRLQINFRNHRKIVLVDGKVAFVGGINVQDDSLGRSKYYGPWRDTHARLRGPAVRGVYRIFMEDYHWASGGRHLELPAPELEAAPGIEGEGMSAVYVASGPSDENDAGTLFVAHSINSASHRVWLASPYFVPGPSVMDALKMATLRGVDVRVVIPLRWDLLVMHLAAFAYFPEAARHGVRFYRYRPGYPHQKVMLIDEEVAWVGSSNLDPRSMQLNFEGNLVVVSREFASAVAAMLEKDMAQSQRVGVEDYLKRGPLFKLGVKIARLFEPIL